MERVEKGQVSSINRPLGDLTSGHGGTIPLGKIKGPPIDGRVHARKILPTPRGVTA